MMSSPSASSSGTMTEPSARRRKILALIFSGVFPGLGQLYNRQPIKGAAFLAAGVLLSWLLGRAVPADVLELVRLRANLVMLLSALLALWLWSVIDAWRVAGR